MNWADYKITTSAEDYEDWPWFRERLAAIQSGQAETGRSLSGGPTPIDSGLRYVQWVLETPSVCDLLFKGSQGIQLNHVERNLLILSVSYFEIVEGIAQQTSRLSGTWPLILDGMKGKFDLGDTAAARKQLALNTYFFT